MVATLAWSLSWVAGKRAEPPIAPAAVASRQGVETGGAPASWPEGEAKIAAGAVRDDLFREQRDLFALPGAMTARDARPRDQASAMTEGTDDSVPDIRLRALRRAPFRFQLRGYLGDGDRPLAVFLDLDSGGISVARVGTELGGGGWTFQDFTVQRRGSQRAAERAGVATLAERDSGRRIVLETGKEAVSEALQAVCEVEGGMRWLGEGDTVLCRGETFRVDRIQAAPAEVTLSRLTAGGPIEAGVVKLEIEEAHHVVAAN